MIRAVLALVLVALWCATPATVSPSSTTAIPIQGACPATASPVYVPVAATTFGDVAIDPGCQYVYLTNTTLNRLEIYSLQTLSFEAPISVGAQPAGLDITPDGSLVYVANSGGNNISVVSLAQRIELRKITVPNDGSNFSPLSIAIANNGRALFSTSNGGGGSLRELILATDLVSTRADFASLAVAHGTNETECKSRPQQDRCGERQHQLGAVHDL
jgi:DNA-binding beta-propeller fold protein YncE